MINKNIHKKKSIRKIYKEYFIRRIVVPIFLIFFVSISMILYFSKQEIESKATIVTTQTADTLENELKNYSIQLSHLVNANDGEFTKSLSCYFDNSFDNRYVMQQKMRELYAQAVASSFSMIGINFYSIKNQSYGYKNDINESILNIRKLNIYNQSIEKKDLVVRGVLESKQFYFTFNSGIDEKILVFMYSPEKYNVNKNIDIAILTAPSDALELIRNSTKWTNGISVYLVNEKNEILEKSDDKYIQDLNTLRLNKFIYKSEMVVGYTGWKVISVASTLNISYKYQMVIVFIFIAVMLLVLFFYLYSRELLKNIINPINVISKTMNKIQKEAVFESVNLDGPEEIVTISTIYNEMIVTIENLLEENTRKEKEKKREEILALESQINPHFLSNAINSIQFMAKVAKYTSIEKMAESLNKILAESFRNKMSSQPFKEAMEVLYAYIYIMQIRYANGFEVKYDIDEECYNYSIPKLILQPFIENAIVHGVSEIDDVGIIKITIKIENDYMHFSVWDNGKGISKQDIITILNKKPENGKKIAVANIRQRLKLYYGEKCDITINSEQNKYTEILFKIALKNL